MVNTSTKKYVMITFHPTEEEYGRNKQLFKEYVESLSCERHKLIEEKGNHLHFVGQLNGPTTSQQTFRKKILQNLSKLEEPQIALVIEHRDKEQDFYRMLSYLEKDDGDELRITVSQNNITDEIGEAVRLEKLAWYRKSKCKVLTFVELYLDALEYIGSGELTSSTISGWFNHLASTHRLYTSEKSADLAYTQAFRAFDQLGH